MSDDVITMKQAGKRLAVDASTLRRWVNMGKLTAKRHPISNHRLFNRDEVEALARQIEAVAR